MSLQTFRHFTICQDHKESTVEVWRSAGEVACLAFDNQTNLFVELHVSIGPAEGQWDAVHFEDLIREAATVRHPHLLGIIEGGEDEGTNYYVSEYLDGERLDTWLARCSALPPWLALLLIRQIIDGLAALASHPRLLAGVEVFHAGLALVGPRPGDLSVKICDLGLTDTAPRLTSPQLIEARAIRDTGRLLLYMLTSKLPEGPDITSWLGKTAIAPELTFLLVTICNPASPHHPHTLEQLRTLTARCTQELAPGLTACPELLPADYRPRLPLAHHLPDPAAHAELLSNDYTLDTRPPDSAGPYRHRAIQRATRRPVNVQVFPPPNLLPASGLFPALEKAWMTLSPNLARPAPASLPPNLLAPLAHPPETAGHLLVEEYPGKYTLETLYELRHPLEPGEVLLILSQLDAAATAAESLGLPLHWRCPRLIPVQFTGPGGEEALPPPSQLARLPITAWPPFLLKVRTWPIALNFTQPGRFQLERLLPNDPALPTPAASSPATSGGPPSARDFALLSTWLLGGTAKVPEHLKSLLYTAISTRGPALDSRAAFLQRFQQRQDHVPTAPIALFPTPLDPPPSTAPVHPYQNPAGKDLPSLVLKARPKSESKALSTTPALQPAAGSPDSRPGAQANTTPPAALLPGHDQRFLEEPEELPALGFAEALFGDAMAEPAAPPNQPLWPAFADDAAHPPGQEDSARISHPPEDDSYPQAEDGRVLGFMEASGQSAPHYHPDYDKDYLDDDDEEAMDGEGASGINRWLLFLIVILIAAALAGVMAHLSGQAIWLK